MEEMLQEIKDIEKSTIIKEESSCSSSSILPSKTMTKMEDLLLEMQRLSAKHKEQPYSSNKEEYEAEGASTTGNYL